MPFRPFHWRRDVPFAGALLLLLGYLILGDKPWDLEPGAFESDFRTRTNAYVVEGLYWAAAINSLLLFVAWLVGARWFPRDHEVAETPLSPKSPSKKAVWVIAFLVLLAAVFSANLNFKRLDHSLWGDEESTTQKEILGMVYPTDDGESYRIVTPQWKKTLWNWDRGPGNQVAYSAAARLVHGDAEPASAGDPHGSHISERKLRLPAWIAGIATVLAVGWLAWTLGFPGAAPVASWLVALHPWFIRWASEARGYSFVMLLAPLAVIFLLKGTRSGHWRWWLLLGVSQFLLLWSHLGSVYFLIALNGGGALYVWSLDRRFLRGRAFWQLVAASLFGAVLTLQMMGPLVKQLLIFIEKDPLSGELNAEWFSDWAAYWLTGMPWNEANPGGEFSLNLEGAAMPLIAGAGLLALLFLGGCWTVFSRKAIRWVGVVLLLPAPLFVIHAVLQDSVIYPWYVVGFLPLFLVVIALGTQLWKAVWYLGPVAVGMMFLIAEDQRRHFVEHPIEPLRESVAVTREVTNPWHPDYNRGVLTLGFVHPTRLYDPGMIFAKNDDEALAALREAKISGKPLYLNAANLGLMDTFYPRLAELFADGETFTLVEKLDGQFLPATTRFVYRYNPE